MIRLYIKGTNGSISIELLGYENAAAQNASDANWLKTRIKVISGPFCGEIAATMTTHDFSYFEKELIELLLNLKGKAKFQTNEEWLSFEIEIGALGTAIVRGTAKANDGSRSSLAFSFETDQSYLEQTRQLLSSITQNFPVQRKEEAPDS